MTLHDVHPNNVLRIKNGSIVRSLYDLANELALMDEDVFRHHVSDTRNDFYEWVYHMVRDVHLAKVFSEIKDRRLMLAAVEKRVRQLENPEQPAGHPLHWGAREYLFGVIVGAIAMLMISRLL
jgi:hypothetical protein